MELRQLRYFLAVARTLNFSRAAEQLRVAQPSLSRQIRELEERMGFKLFERSTVRVELTKGGEFFQRRAEKILTQLAIAETAAQRIARGIIGELRIGTWHGAPRLAIAEAAQRLHLRAPRLSIDFLELPFFGQIQSVRERKLDVGFAGRWRSTPKMDKDLCHCLIYRGMVSVVLPAWHTASATARVRLQDLKNEAWVTLGDARAKSTMAKLLKSEGCIPKFARTASSIEGVLALVTMGEGIALMPKLFLPEESPGVRYVDTNAEPYEVYAIWLRDNPSAHVKDYIEDLKRESRAEPGGDAPGLPANSAKPPHGILRFSSAARILGETSPASSPA
jgi:LysR family transcriptional regulator, benzoate and cis,cis-muconate-responsive activator of ben and cat genes